MVHFEPQDDAAERADAGLAPVTYLPGAAPGMKRRSPLHPRLEDGFPDFEIEGTAAAAANEAASAHRVSDHLDDEANAAADFVADALEKRERAEKVLLHRLRGRSLSTVEALLVLNTTGVDSGEASEIIEKFIELNYLDEVKLADQIIHSHNVRKGLGRTGVEAEMRRRKLDPSVMLDKLEELPDDEAERAIDLATKRIAQMERFDDQTIDRRLTGFLMRKGYSSTAVRLAVKAAMDNRGGGGASRVRFR
ncbi:MAG: RecX family transcriptional regulator [Cryobacterium sp.]|uniref:regulatory protein RecX n=1 Tax=unclassified Cryobacterium TaxID=2649013 RepID=UPI0018CB00F5|nr:MULTISPECIES: regulatory protein RecX [unclassified Cryobacterium]MCY7403434.1 RecX family transcriptional regulator [Cryobacterium sp.]MEC5155555.1 regulatory protein [Cryobacterium sp. CAN_C3]